MRKLLSATLLSLLFTAGATAHTSEPIRPVPQEAFKPVEVAGVDREKYIPKPTLLPTPKPTKNPAVTGFTLDKEVSWYGPGFYGKRTACGLAYTTELLGVAHRTLPCGTLVSFRNPKNGRVETVPVIDRGPYVDGRKWDLSGGLCVALDHCYTGSIEVKVHK